MQAGASLETTTEPDAGPGWTLLRVLDVFDRAAIRYSVLHGYEHYPHKIGSDVDCIIDPATPATRIHALLHRNSTHIGAEMVVCRGYYIVLAGRRADGSHFFLTLDLMPNCDLDGVPLYSGDELIAERRPYQELWIPPTGLEFGCYLARSIAKGVLDDARTQRLSSLYHRDMTACAGQVARFWSTQNAHLILAAAESGDWSDVRRQLDPLRAELRVRAIRRQPVRFLVNKVRALMRRIESVCRPNGLNVVLLGPDGAGKSSVIDGTGPKLLGPFARTICTGFAPPLHRLFRRGGRRTDQPHALPVRSLPTSLIRAVYWLAYYTAGYLPLHWALARSTLVLNDRHFIDILVDARRYRYGGPPWLLRLIWRAVPKPDMVILLDAPPQVLQARKQEVPFNETVRQRSAYLALTQSLPNGYVVDASRSRERVAADVSNLILKYLAARLERRLCVERRPSGSIVPEQEDMARHH